MAERRILSKKITNSAKFLKMPISTQALYFHLCINADDDGVVEAYNVIKMLGVGDDDLKVLVTKEYATVLNEDLVTFIMDWQEHSRLRSDRKIDSIYADLLLKMIPNLQLHQAKPRADTGKKSRWASNGRPVDAISKDKLSKVKITKEKLSESNVPARTPIFDTLEKLSSEVRAVLKSWGQYAGVNEGAELTALVNLIASKVDEFGDKAVVDLINDMMASGYRKIFWDRLDKAKASALPATNQSENNANAYDFSAFELGGSD